MDVSAHLHDLFPQIEPFSQGTLDLDGIHRMYWEQSGNPTGIPVLFLHGGPGAGGQPIYRRFFDPNAYRVVIFDQRGCGRSRPLGEITNNTTQHLIDDIEKLRDHLGIQSWLVMGGSWGSTLALAYGVAHPDRCLGFILRGVFLGRQSECDWFMDGMGTIFPDIRRDFVGFLPEAERDDPLASYYKRLTHSDSSVSAPAARAWCNYEGACSTLLPKPPSVPGLTPDSTLIALARLEAHYLVHKCFMDDGYLIGNISKINHLPCAIVQGRYDIVCPIKTADEVVHAWPGCRYAIVSDAGHSALEPGIRMALIDATEGFKAELRK